MKKYIVVRLMILVLFLIILLLSLGTYGMLHTVYVNFFDEAYGQISQIQEILLENDKAVDELQEDLKEDFLIRANTVAYMIQDNQEIIYDIEQLEHITELLQIDEIHLFTPEGEIYSGTVPDYYGFTFESGAQMQFFAPMLDDYELELAQDVTPNTAEGKEMQYVAVWSEDRQHIVQIGIEPLRLLEAMETTEIPYIFDRLSHSVNTIIFTVDSKSGEVINSTDSKIENINLSDFGLENFKSEDVGATQNVRVAGEMGHLLLISQASDTYIGYFESHSSVYNSTLIGIAVLVTISIALSFVIISQIYVMLDKVVLRGLSELEQGIELVASGDLEHKLNVTGLPEFEALSNNVNFMVKRVVESSRKFSTIFEYINLPIAMYECKTNAVIATGKLSEILHITDEEFLQDYKSPTNFLALIEEIMSNPVQNENDIYAHSTKEGKRYLKIMRYQDGESDWGIIVDSTDEVIEKSKIMEERDLDFLTGLFGKRSFFEQMERLSNNPEKTKKAVVIMFDLDNLKYVNDTWGHETGDNFISTAASVLHNCEYENKLCSRLSGDEFAMIIYGQESYKLLEDEIDKIKEQFAKTYIETPDGNDHKVSASIGYSLYPEQSDTFKICLNFADKAMYMAKSKQKGSVERYDRSNTYDIGQIRE